MKHVTVNKIKKFKNGKIFGLTLEKAQSGIFCAGWKPEELEKITVIALRQNDVESGKIAVVSLDGGFPCLMRVYHSNGQILLSTPTNMDFQDNRTAAPVALSEAEAAERLEILAAVVEVGFVLAGGGGVQ